MVVLGGGGAVVPLMVRQFPICFQILFIYLYIPRTLEPKNNNETATIKLKIKMKAGNAIYNVACLAIH